jgi:hypothetical protein
MEFSGNQPWILLQKNSLLKYGPEISDTLLTTPYSQVSPMKKKHCAEKAFHFYA